MNVNTRFNAVPTMNLYAAIYLTAWRRRWNQDSAVHNAVCIHWECSKRGEMSLPSFPFHPSSLRGINRPILHSCKQRHRLKAQMIHLSLDLVLLGSFSNDDGDGSEDVKKAIGLLRKTTSLHVHHAFLYISLPSLHVYDVKMPNCKFYGWRKQATTNLFFCL